MERFSQRESILLGYNPQRSSTNSSTPHRDSDVDFHDVFGGPPRRSSVHEMRYSVNELPDVCGSQKEDEAPSCPWPAVAEKPVFGEENINRRRYPNEHFFDDIFGGDESVSCTPRKHERDPFSTAPGSRILSPARPLPSGADPFATSSLPATLSLPAKLTKGMDLPTFGSPTRGLHKNIKDGTSNGLSSSDSPATPLSRFSSQATQGKEELNNDLRTYRRSLLSQQFSDLSISDKADKGGDSAGQFHFSIYKWASKGIPLVMPLRAEKNSRTKDKVKFERCSSAKDWIVSESITQNDSPLAYTGSSLMKNRKQDGPTPFTSPQNGAGSRKFIEDIVSAKPHLQTVSSLQNVIEYVPGSAISCDPRVESSTHSVRETGFSGKTKGYPVYANETQKPESKPLHFLFGESDDKQDNDEKTDKEKGQENKAKSTQKSSANCDVSINSKKREKKTAALKVLEVSKATSQGSLSLDENIGNGRFKGKVKEFVRIFNQEALTKPGVDTKSRLQGSKYRLRGSLRTKNEVEDNPEQSKKEDSAIETTNMSGRQDDISASDTAIPDSTVAVGDKDKDEFFHGNFLVKELAQDENEVLQTQDNQEIKLIDVRIQQWSKGKEGNIRSLLSTLQYVLWPESGWKPVPLVDIIEGNAVRRAYQRALLCLHPDKLQQKDAASHQKYTAAKVYDILQEAWTRFNMLGAL